MPVAFLDTLRDAFRSSQRSRAYLAAVVVTMALATAAVAVVAAIVNGVLLRPLPFPDPDRVVIIWEQVPGDEGPRAFRVAAANYADWRDRSRSFSALGLFSSSTVTMAGAGEARELRGVRATASYFTALGVVPAAGRLIEAADESPAMPQVVVLSHGLWMRQFGGRPDAVGRTLTMGGESVTVVGIMPRGLYPAWPQNPATLDVSPDSQEFWVPMRWTPQLRANRGTHVFGVVGRLAPGVSIERVRAELGGLAAALAREYPATNEGTGAIVSALADEWTAPVRPALQALLGAVLLVWLLACANLAGLATTRAAGRQLDVAVRAALGATRGRLAVLAAAESALIVAGGMLMGLVLAAAGLTTLVALLPDAVPRAGAIRIGAAESSVAAMLSLVASLVLAGASIVSWNGGPRELVSGTRTVARSGLARRGLVVVQVALTVVVTLGAGLLVRSFAVLTSEPAGFDGRGLVVADLALPRPAYTTAAEIDRFQTALTDDLRRAPGVEAVTLAYDRPFEASWSDNFRLEGDPRDRSGDARRSAWLRLVGPGYFETLKLPIVDGRGFASTDTIGRPGVAVVNERFARAVFGDANPIGRILESSSASGTWGDAVPARFEIVGIAGDARFRGLALAPEPAFYLSLRQFPSPVVTAIVRSPAAVASVAADLRAIVRRADPTVPVERVATVEDTLDRQLADRRLTRNVLATFGGAALALAALGLYGVLAVSIAQRTRELGVRLALGAQPRQLGSAVVLEALLLCAAGVGTGGVLALGLARAGRSLLHGISPADPPAVGVTLVTLMAVALVASYIPARRAARIDPVEALRR